MLSHSQLIPNKHNRLPRCNFCLKELRKASHVQLHIQNTKACREKWDNEVMKRPLPSQSNQSEKEDISDNSLAEMSYEQEGPDIAGGPGFEDESALFDMHLPRQPYSSSGSPEPPVSKRARVEEVEDEEVPTRFHRSYPGRAADVVGFGATGFEEIRADQASSSKASENPWEPFMDEEEWELAEWLMTETTQQARDKFLKLPIVCVYHFCSKVVY